MKKICEQVQVYGLENAIRVAKFPMAVQAENCTQEETPTQSKLAQSSSGTGHDHFLSGILVQCDITASNKFWIEWQRYHFAEINSSQSTMHRITRFNLDDCYHPLVDELVKQRMKELIDSYNNIVDRTTEEAKQLYLTILYTNPSGMLLTAGVTMNYLGLKTMYQQRRNHRLPEWQEFCNWIETLPHSHWITQNHQKGFNL